MARNPKPRFVAYRFVDPLTSPRIKGDESLAALCDYLEGRTVPSVFGPAIYHVPVKHGRLVDEKTGAIGIGLWAGGRKIRLFEFVTAPPAPGVEFIRQVEFIDEGSNDGEEENSSGIRDDG